ncbi:MAG: response regulator transcription factor [Treponema sp.]|nr:response regulator transcription factor [Treponema sp.]
MIPLVLVVDDEEKILNIIKSYLEKTGYHCLCAATGKEGMDLFEQNSVSLILLDIMLPDFSGEEFCRRVRSFSDVPIIMITARVDEESIIRLLNLGADDYVTKPFSPRELMARVRSCLRRGGESAHGGDGARGRVLTAGGLAVDTENRRVSRNGAEVTLTPNEYHILTLLMSRPQKIFTREEIIEEVKSDDFDGFDRAIDSHIKNLRQKIEDDSRNPRYILTVYGMGYRFSIDAENGEPW